VKAQFPYVDPATKFVTQEWLDEQDENATRRDAGIMNALLREVKWYRFQTASDRPRLIETGKPKTGKCCDCGSTFEYMPEHIKCSSLGDFDSQLVNCPRPKCKGYHSVR